MRAFVVVAELFFVAMMVIFGLMLFYVDPEKYFWAADVGKVVLFATGVFFGRHIVGENNG